MILSVTDFVKYSINSAPYNNTRSGRIISHETNGYTIEIDGKTYTGVKYNASIGTLSKNDIVTVIVPNNQMNNVFILCKLIK